FSRDWSSDVCSSDLVPPPRRRPARPRGARRHRRRGGAGRTRLARGHRRHRGADPRLRAAHGARPADREPRDARVHRVARRGHRRPHESVAMTAQGVSGWARALLWAGEAVAWLTVLGICVALVWLCVRISRQRPFGRSVTTALNWVAVLVIVGGTTSGVLADFGRGTVVAEAAPQAVARS